MALSGYFILPDVPEITKSWYLTERVKPSINQSIHQLIFLADCYSKEIFLAKKRMELEGRKPRAKYTKAKLKRMLSSWHIYLLALLYL